MMKLKKIIVLLFIVLATVSTIQLFTIEGTATTPNGYKYTYKGGLVKVCTGSKKAFEDVNP